MKTLKTRKTYYSNLINGEEYDKFLCIIEQFDASENLIEKHTLNIDGSTTLSEYFQYQNDQMTRKEIHDPETDQRSVSEYKYQGNRLIEEKELFENDQFIKTSYTYNANNDMIQVIQIDESKAILSKTTLTYSPGKIKINRFGEDARLLETESIDVDKDGNDVRCLITAFDIDDKQNDKSEGIMSINRVFEEGKMISEEIERDDVLIERSALAFDEFENLEILEVFNFNVDYILIYNYEYNELNLETSAIEFHDDKQVSAKFTKYDVQNKPIEVTEEVVSLDDYVATKRQEFVSAYYENDEH